ncbi:MAG: cytochrome c biogenesis protein CcsA [Kofleriaceae bacterium]
MPVLAVLTSVGLVASLWGVFVTTPLADVLFFNQKIFYFHVAHAFMLFASVFACAVCSAVYLKTRNPRWDDVALATAEVAVVLGAAVLITGMIWAKAAWDVWWKWEKRLTMSLLLWLTLVGYVMVRRFAGAGGERLAAALAVFAAVALPFIYTMVDQGDLHPQAGARGNVATLGPAMRGTFWLAVATFLGWTSLLVTARVASARAERRAAELRERALDAGLLGES